MKKITKKITTYLDGPLLDMVKTKFADTTDFTQFPFSIPLIKNLQDIHFPQKVTFFVGENGSGKSTLLEALAYIAGFGPEGGSKNIHFKTAQEEIYTATQRLADCMTLSWRMKPFNGYFFRAESFYNIANHLDYLAREGGDGPRAYDSYGGKSLHQQSHGESFLSFFTHRMGADGFYILDEPEAALSPQRQLTLLTIMHDLCKSSNTQFIIATHSPLLLAYPKATIYSCDANILKTIKYTQTQHYQITKRFLDNPDHYLRMLFGE